MAVAPATAPGLPRTLESAVLPARVRRVLQNLQQTASTEVERQLQIVLHETELELARLATPSRTNQNEATHAESLRTLRKHAHALVPRFIEELEAGLAQVRAPRVSRQPEIVSVLSQELSLVEDTGLDEDAVLGDIATRSQSRNSLALQLMGQRFGVLAGGPAFEAEHLPVGPHGLCFALRDAATGLGLTLDARLHLYRQFDKVAMAHVPFLLEALNARLMDDGILPHLNFVPVRRRAASQPRAAQAATQPAPGRSADSAGHVEVQAAAPAANKGLPGSAGADFAGLQGLLARRRQLLAKLRSSTVDDRVRETLPPGDVQAALRQMRKSVGKTGTPGEIRQTLLAQARQSTGHGVALDEADSDGFELFGLFVGQLHRELRRDSAGDVMVDRLKLPLLQMALRDHRFFVDPAHPARMLLDAVSLAGARWLAEDDLDAQWLGLLQRAVGTVLEDPDAGDDAFVVANHALQAGLQAAARKNEMAERRHVEAAHGREKLELARLRASSEIAQLMAGRQMPRFHGMLIEQAWTDVLSLVLLRNGDKSNAWRDIREATAAIIEASTSPVERSPDPAFLATLHDALSQVGYHAEDAVAIARQLAHGRAEDADLASRTELVVQLKARARLGEDKLALARATLPPRNDAEQAAYDSLGASKEGRWIDLHDAAQDTVIRRRLAWASARTGHALVLNRRSLRIDGADLDALARMQAAGRLQVVKADLHPAELAWQLTLANLQRLAGERIGTGEAA